MTHALSLALGRLREAIRRQALADTVPPADLEEILWKALRAVPAGLDGHALERRLLAEVRQALAVGVALAASLVIPRESLARQALHLRGVPEGATGGTV